MSLFYKGIDTSSDVLIKSLDSDKIEKILKTPETTEGLKKGIIIDTETTGLDSSKDKIIEIGAREFFFNSNLEIVGLGKSFNQLQDPKMEISKEITEITGITNEDVLGQSIDWELLNTMISSSEVIVAHNAAFDSAFLKKEELFTQEVKIWACSFAQIPWRELGFKSGSLEVLGLLHGFFYSGHRALIDVDAVAYLLSHSDYFKTLHNASMESTVRVKAVGADFESKDQLKSKGYKWNVKERFWWKDESSNSIDEVKSWLQSEIYLKKPFKFCQFEEISPYDRF